MLGGPLREEPQTGKKLLQLLVPLMLEALEGLYEGLGIVVDVREDYAEALASRSAASANHLVELLQGVHLTTNENLSSAGELGVETTIKLSLENEDPLVEVVQFSELVELVDLVILVEEGIHQLFLFLLVVDKADDGL